ncbi:MAG: hypothetical protein IPM45_03255 [Acidimicrobiales bacterium]|nr:hypothetical protein [Acidimicrobiales bacterium]
MALTDAERLRLHRRLEEALGPDEAALLMTAVPPVGWSDLVTNDVLRSELVLVRAELRGDMAELRGEFAELRGEFAELRGHLDLQLAHQTRLYIAATVTLVLAAMAVSFAAAVIG